jgi:hypothetical protein
MPGMLSHRWTGRGGMEIANPALWQTDGRARGIGEGDPVGAQRVRKVEDVQAGYATTTAGARRYGASLMGEQCGR